MHTETGRTELILHTSTCKIYQHIAPISRNIAEQSCRVALNVILQIILYSKDYNWTFNTTLASDLRTGGEDFLQGVQMIDVRKNLHVFLGAVPGNGFKPPLPWRCSQFQNSW